MDDSLCPQPKPNTSKSCSYSWDISAWSECSNDQQTRTVVCKDYDGNTVSDSLCPQPKPTGLQVVDCDSILCGDTVDNYPYAPDTNLCAAPAILSGSVTPRTGGRIN